MGGELLHLPNSAGRHGKRLHRAVVLGLKSELRKWEAEKKLVAIIEAATKQSAGPFRPDEPTFGWFWENRYRPMKEPRWQLLTKRTIDNVMARHVLPTFGETPLVRIEKFAMQVHLNDLAKSFSSSIVKKVRSYLGAILAEALEQDFIAKDPARRLETPPTRESSDRFLTTAEIRLLFSQLVGRERLMFHLLWLCALRPGELFALRWRCVEQETLAINETAYEGKVKKPKTRASKARVWLSISLRGQLEWWRQQSATPPAPESLVFTTRSGQPIHAKNFLRDVLAPAAKRAGIQGLNHQVLRRTFATLAHDTGASLKDAQGQLRHSSIGTTGEIYTKVIPESVKAAVEALDRSVATTYSQASPRVN